MKIKFFKPGDFESVPGFLQKENVASEANAKLEREGKVYYGNKSKSTFHTDRAHQVQYEYKALLINIEPIETCTHPMDKIGWTGTYKSGPKPIFKCECGARVTPTSYEVCE